MVGYNPLKEMAAVEPTDFSDASENTSKALTRVMVLHPVACALSFIAFLLALGSGFIGAIFAALVASLAFIVTVVVMACDFVLFGIVKNKVNDNDSDSYAEFSAGMWTILAAMIMLFLATVIVLPPAVLRDFTASATAGFQSMVMLGIPILPLGDDSGSDEAGTRYHASSLRTESLKVKS